MTEAGVAYVGIRFNPEDVARLGATAREAGKTAGLEAGEETSAGMKSGLLGGTKGIIAGFAAVFAAAKVYSIGKEAIAEASQTQKATENIRAQFGKAAQSLLNFSDTAARSFGISKNASEGFSSQIGLVTKNLGLGKDEGAKMAEGLQKLAGAVGLIKGQDPETYFKKLQSALLGNTRGLKDMGITFTSAQEKQEALRLGIKGSTSDWTAAQKAQIIYQLAIKQLPALLADAKKHSGDLADQQIKLSAEWSNLKEELGAALLPALTKLVTFLAKYLPPAMKLAQEGIDKIRPAIKQFSDVVKTAFEWFIQTGIPAFIKAWQSIRSQVFPTLTAFEGLVAAVVGFVKKVWSAFGSTIMSVAKTAFHTAIDLIKSGLQIIRGVIEIFTGILEGKWGKVWKGIKDVVAGAWHGIVAIVKGAAQVLETAAVAAGTAIFNGIWGAIKGIPGKVGGLLSDIGGVLRKVPQAVVNAATSAGSTIFHAIVNGLGDLAGQIVQWVKDALSNLNPFSGGGGAGGGNNVTSGAHGRGYSGGRAIGGPVYAGSSYLVGERGPELFTPSMNGLITPNGGGNITVIAQIGDEQFKPKVVKIIHESNQRTARRVRAGSVW